MTIKATRRDVERIAKRFGGELIIHCEPGPGSELDFELIAPCGYHWEGEGVHAIVGHQNDGERVALVYQDAIDRATGIEKCSSDNGECCDWNGWERTRSTKSHPAVVDALVALAGKIA